MVHIPFIANDETVRNDSLHRTFFTALEALSSESEALWGKMTPRQMIEHLIWALEISNGFCAVQCTVPPKLIERFKAFLFNDMPTSHDFMNPELKKGLPPNRYSNLNEAIDALRHQMKLFLEQDQTEKNKLRIHPVFGPLSHEEWSRSHFKHFYHHLLQFGLIET